MTANLQQNFERLSSGLRINCAADDAAGLAISSILDTGRRVLTRASANVGDAISLLTIADAAVDSVKQLVTRMTELAEQAANGTLNFQQRSNLNKEYSALDKEIRRITETTKFNGLNLLTGGHTVDASAAVRIGTANGYTYESSDDGRYITYCRNLSALDFDILDTVTGETWRIAGPDESHNVYDAQVLSNGDAIISGGDLMDLYYWSRQNRELTKLTNNQNIMNFSEHFEVSADGSTVIFRSETYYKDGGTTADVTGYDDTSERIYTLSLQTGLVREISQTATYEIGLSPDGSKAFYGTDALYVVELGRDSSAPLKKTRFAGSASAMSITNEGDFFFTSTGNITGQNPGGAAQIYRGSLLTGAYTQLTGNTSAFVYFGLRANNDGTSFFFRSNLNLTGENPGGVQEGFKFDLLTGQTTQLTRFGSNIGITGGFFSADGGLMVYLTGTNRFYVDVRGSASAFNIEVGAGQTGTISSEIPALFSAQKGLGAYTITSASAARSTLDGLRSNLAGIGSLQGKIGAAQSRLQSAQNVILSQTIETAAASSRIKDVDVASESATLLKNQILQQGAAAVLSQANQAPALALKLLNG